MSCAEIDVSFASAWHFGIFHCELRVCGIWSFSHWKLANSHNF